MSKLLHKHLADNAVETINISDISVTTEKLADQAVTSDKLAQYAINNMNFFSDILDVALGLPTLDANGKLQVSQLPNSIMEYQGLLDGSTGIPVGGSTALINGTGNAGDVYRCSVAGTYDYGNPSGNSITLNVGDYLICGAYSATPSESHIWGKADNSDQELRNDLASVANGLGASLIGVEDAGANFTATTVEGVLTELDAAIGQVATAAQGLVQEEANARISDVASLEVVDSDLSSDISELVADVASLEAVDSDLSSDISELVADVASLEAVDSDLSSDISELVADVASLEAVDSDLSSDISELVADVASLEAVDSDLSSDISELVADVASLEAVDSDLSSDISELVADVASLEAVDSDLSSDISELVADVASLEAVDSDLSSDISELVADVASLEAVDSDLSSDISELVADVASLEAVDSDLSSDISELVADVASLEAVDSDLSSDISELVADVASLEAVDSDLSSDISELVSDIESIDQALDNLSPKAESHPLTPAEISAKAFNLAYAPTNGDAILSLFPLGGLPQAITEDFILVAPSTISWATGQGMDDLGLAESDIIRVIYFGK